MNPLPLLATFAVLSVVGAATVQVLDYFGKGQNFTDGLADAAGICGAAALIGLLAWVIVGLVA